MRSAEGLRDYCMDLSTDVPSPGGGAASASAGAMAASLLVMVCGITSKSKKHSKDWPELATLKGRFEGLRDELLSLTSEDAASYDAVIEAIREVRSSDTEENRHSYQSALRHASDVPMRTSEKCLAVLEQAARVAEIGSRSATSDTGVAVLLSEAGMRGAAMNVDINLKDMTDAAFAKAARKTLDERERRARALVKECLGSLRGPSV